MTSVKPAQRCQGGLPSSSAHCCPHVSDLKTTMKNVSICCFANKWMENPHSSISSHDNKLYEIKAVFSLVNESCITQVSFHQVFHFRRHHYITFLFLFFAIHCDFPEGINLILRGSGYDRINDINSTNETPFQRNHVTYSLIYIRCYFISIQ